MGVTRLASAAAAAAIALTIAPPALAEPEPRPGQLVTVAGIGESGFAGDGGDAREARLGGELDVAVAQNGVVYIADGHNDALRVVGADGVINSISLADPENIGVEPLAVAVAPAGVLYVATSRDVRRMNPDGSFTVVAGGGRKRFDRDGGGDGGDGGPATEASLFLMDLAVAGDGTLYLSDWGSKRIRRVTQDGTITTVVPLSAPGAVAAGPGGTVYFIDLSGSGVQKADANGTVTAVLGQHAGEGFAGDGGPSTEAKFGAVTGIATDEAGNLYVADAHNGNIRVIDTSGVIDTIGPSMQALGDVTVGPNDDLYLVGDAKVLRLVRGGAEPATGTMKAGPARWRDQDPGTVLPVAGAGRQPTDAEEFGSTAHSVAVGKDGTVYYTISSDDKIVAIGKDRAAIKVDSPGAVATDQAGNVYVVEELDFRIRKIDAAGKATTFAGTGARAEENAPNGDGGPATAAPISPASLATGRDGSVYVGEMGTSGRIRKVDPHGIITTIAGGGEQRPGDTTRAQDLYLGHIDALAVDANGVVHFTSRGQVYAVTAAGAVAPVAGTGGQGFSGDGGPATQAQVNLPSGLAVGKDGTRYLADTDNNRVRAIRTDGTINTVATLNEPQGIAADQAGNLYVTTDGGSQIRKIDRKGTITTVERIGLFVDPDATKTVLGSPSAVCVDATGTVYAAGAKLVLAATAAGKAREVADMSYVEDMAAGPDGSVYVVNRDRVERFYPDGAQVTVAGGAAGGANDPIPDADGKRATSVVLDPEDVAVGPAGELYLTSGSRVYRLNRDGTLAAIVDMNDKPGVEDSDEYLLSIAVRHDGVLYVAHSDSHRVFVVRDGRVSTFAGTGDPGRIDESGDGDKATEAPVGFPGDLAVDRDGTVYIAAGDGVRRVTREGEIDTVVEKQNGTAASAIALDQHGNLYFTASELHQVRVLVRPGELPRPFSWAVIWIGLMVVAVVGYVMFAVVQRKVKKTRPAS